MLKWAMPRPPRSAAKSLRAQTLHYLSRPHQGAPRGPVGGPAAWRAADHADTATWTHELSGEERASIEAELARSEETGKPTAALSREDVPLAALRPVLDAWRLELVRGRGFARLRGVPVQDWPYERVERFTWAIGLQLGHPGVQNDEGDLLGHVRDTGDRSGKVRQYKTNESIGYHCDAADVVGLLCVKPARQGGLSRIASSVALHDAVLAEDPEAAAALFDDVWIDSRGEGGTDAFRVPQGRFYDGQLRTFFHSGYVRSAQNHPGIPPLTEAQRRLIERYDELAATPRFHLEMALEPGDLQLISNHTIVHSRTGYVDAEDPAERRHLLRLWLSIETPVGLGERLMRARATVELVGGLVRRRLDQRLHGAR